MPELPEVETTVRGLNNTVRGLTITDVWTDYKSNFHRGKLNIKDAKYFQLFHRAIVGAQIEQARRVAKNILIDLSNGITILIHMKMTGHLLYGEYQRVIEKRKKEVWIAKAGEGDPLLDPFNRWIHLVFSLSNGKQLAFSDLRKFAKVRFFETGTAHEIEDLRDIGPEPLDRSFTYQTFVERLMMRPGGKIKQVLMDQSVIAGIGNIYSDELLWKAAVHPLSAAKALPPKVLKTMYTAMRDVLAKGIDFGGDSTSDYRNIYGERGTFQHRHNVYRRTKESCPKKGCGGTIKRIKVGGRSAHFCDTHQILYH
jgi:formamidopyrimidine-DNA glycosylase